MRRACGVCRARTSLRGPVTSDVPSAVPKSDLMPRVIVGVILIAVALGALRAGGLWFGALATLASLLMFAEWSQMHQIGRGKRFVGLVVIGLSCVGAMLELPTYAVQGLLLVAAVWALFQDAFRRAGDGLAFGLVYAGLPGIALIWLREPNGLGVVLWVLLVVWSTDILAYFAGRAIGGPKIAPRISPKKTWAGLMGGMIGASAASAAMAFWWFQADFVRAGGLGDSTSFWNPRNAVAMALIGAGLAIVSQAGDFYESWLKRRAGVKDSGKLLPGHGGVMDRLDGLVPVAVVVALLMAAPGWFG